MTQFIETLKSYSYAGNNGYDYLLSLIIFVGLLIILKLIKVSIVSRLKVLAKKTKNDFDDTVIDILSNVKPPFYLLIALYFGLSVLSINETASKVVKAFFLIAIVFEVIRALESIVDYGVTKYLKGMEGDDVKSNDQSLAMVKSINVIVKVALWVIGLTLILSNLGVNVTSIVASLGIGGLAVALALQNILSDLFSSFSLYIDKPFKLGDFIVVGTHSGTVEKIGLKTTRIRTLQGQELVISNNELTSARVENFKRMEKRRVAFELGVVYETKSAKLENIPPMIEKIITSISETEFDRCHFKTYGDSALIYEIVYYVNSADYNQYMDINQQINLAIFNAFAKEKIEFAYPTQTVYLGK